MTSCYKLTSSATTGTVTHVSGTYTVGETNTDYEYDSVSKAPFVRYAIFRYHMISLTNNRTILLPEVVVIKFIVLFHTTTKFRVFVEFKRKI